MLWVKRNFGRRKSEELIVQLLWVLDTRKGVQTCWWTHSLLSLCLIFFGLWVRVDGWNTDIFSADLESLLFSFQVDNLFLSQEWSSWLNIIRFVSKNAKIKLKSWFNTQIENECWPYCFFCDIGQLANLNLFLLVDLDHLSYTGRIVNPIWHYFCHHLEFLLTPEVLNALTPLKLDTVSLICALFLETLNAIPIDAIVGIPAPHYLEVDSNWLPWLSVS